jgi:hypothetical protein
LAEYTIPKDQKVSLNKLRILPEPVWREFIFGLERAPFSVPSPHGLSPIDASELKDSALELFRVREYFDEKLPDFAAGVAESLQKNLGFPIDEVPAFEERIATLLAITPIAIASKAALLKLEYERKFCTARILTDARPIYIDSPSSPPGAMMIMHNLRITYHDDTGEMREMYFTMDGDDLTTLKGLVDRAEEKTQSLQSLFEAENIHVVAP